MLIKRLYLRNFRVYEDELDLEMPPGLVGIYGANGAGKSTLLEAITFTLWGRARTTKEQIRSSGVGGECVTEVHFEHEGHLYLVRRTLRGANSQVSVEAHCDGILMSTGTRDAERYVESVLGMDDAAFRASVFTEQKQLAAFSNFAPAERRKLVLQLLGITPLDAARDAARKDARDLTQSHDRLRSLLPDLSVLETAATDAAARAAAAATMASDEATAAATVRARAEAAEAAFVAVDRRRQEHEALVSEGRSARREMDAAEQALSAARAELAELDQLASSLTALQEAAAGLDGDEELLTPLAAAEAAGRAAAAARPADPPPPFDPEPAERAARDADALRQDLAATTALAKAAEAEAARLEQAASRSGSLSGEADCPTCGQPLGPAFEKVQAHRAAEAAEAAGRLRVLDARLGELRAASAAADAEAAGRAAAAERARRQAAEWQSASERHQAIQAAAAEAWAAVTAVGGYLRVAELTGWGRPHTASPDTASPDTASPDTASPDTASPGAVPPAAVLTDAAAKLADEVRRKRQIAGQVHQTLGRLEARPRLKAAADEAAIRFGSAAATVGVLREKVRAVAYRPEDLEAAEADRASTRVEAEAAAERSHRAALAAAAERERADSATQRVADARAQHAQLAQLESDARHTARAADLLSEFRNTVVASVGPRLAAQAAALFGELTDNEYEGLDVNPETYQLQISDGGQLYGLDRFSGSEIDLANLALRVAISEHIHFQSGGAVGLLVLDEVFGPLDEDRKARMLLALERLKGRFRQVLVVTHDPEIKEQLPNAIEVIKKPGRRATARVVGD